MKLDGEPHHLRQTRVGGQSRLFAGRRGGPGARDDYVPGSRLQHHSDLFAINHHVGEGPRRHGIGRFFRVHGFEVAVVQFRCLY
jgi:hypothetical protein